MAAVDPRLAGRVRPSRIARDGGHPAGGRLRGAARRGLQPHRRRRRTRPHLQSARSGQRRLLPAAPDDPARYINDMGCGNCLALYSPPALRLTLDSLRHWVTAAGVDGFASTCARALGRLESGFDRDAPLLQALAQDPLLRQVRLVAEPWDIGPGGHQVGGLPRALAGMERRLRDDVRRFWRGDDGLRGALATRLAGSADLFVRVIAPCAPASTSSPPTTASPWPTWSATPKSTTRPMRRQSRRHHRQQELEQWRRRTERRPRRPGSPRRRPARPAGDPDPGRGRTHAHRR